MRPTELRPRVGEHASASARECHSKRPPRRGHASVPSNRTSGCAADHHGTARIDAVAQRSPKEERDPPVLCGRMECAESRYVPAAVDRRLPRIERRLARGRESTCMGCCVKDAGSADPAVWTNLRATHVRVPLHDDAVHGWVGEQRADIRHLVQPRLCAWSRDRARPGSGANAACKGRDGCRDEERCDPPTPTGPSRATTTKRAHLLRGYRRPLPPALRERHPVNFPDPRRSLGPGAPISRLELPFPSRFCQIARGRLLVTIR